MKFLLFLSWGLQILSVTVLFLQIKASFALRGTYSEFVLYAITLIFSLSVFIAIVNTHNLKKLNSRLLLLSLLPCFIILIAMPGSFMGEGCVTDYTSPSGKYSIMIKERCGILGCYPLHIYKNNFLWGYKIGQIKTSGEASCALRARTKVTWNNDETQFQWTVGELHGVVNIN